MSLSSISKEKDDTFLAEMEYIFELRKHIGHKPIILVGAAVFIVDERNRLLLIKRTDNDCWGIPGGAMELGESLEDTARREVKEETGLEVCKMTLFSIYSGADMFYEYPNGDQVYNVTVVYVAESIDGEVQIDLNEHSENKYFDLDDLPSTISPPIEKALSEFIERRVKC